MYRRIVSVEERYIELDKVVVVTVEVGDSEEDVRRVSFMLEGGIDDYSPEQIEKYVDDQFLVMEERKKEKVKRQLRQTLPYLQVRIRPNEITADGRSSATVSIQKYSAKGVALTQKKHNDLILVSTSAGRLSKRVLNLVKGAAKVVLYSSVETVDAYVNAFPKNSNAIRNSIEVEKSALVRFMPAGENWNR